MKRGRVILGLAVIAGALGWVAFQGLRGNLVYYETPTDIVKDGKATVGERIRLGGFVIPGSVHRQGSRIRFVVSDDTTRMTVIHTGGVPSLFRAGQGVVVEGFLGRDGAFHGEDVLIKHNGVYRPPAPGQTPHSANLANG